MKSTDVKVGQSYAWSDWGPGKHRSYYPGTDAFLSKVTVLSAPKNGQVEVQFYAFDSETQKTLVKTTSVRHLKFGWDEHKAALASRQNSKDEALAKGQAADAVVRDLLGAHERPSFAGQTSWQWETAEGQGRYLDDGTRRHNDGSQGYGRYHYTSVEFAEALQKAYAKGRADALAGQEG